MSFSEVASHEPIIENPEEKERADIEALGSRIDAIFDNPHITEPALQEKVAHLARYAETMRRPLTAVVTAMALTFGAVPASGYAQTYESVPETPLQKKDLSAGKGEAIEYYRNLTPEERVRKLKEYSEGVKDAIDKRDKKLFEFNLGEIEKITESLPDSEEKNRIKDNISSYRSMGKFFFFFYGK